MNDLGPAWVWVLVVVSLLLGGGIGFALAARRLPAVRRSQELQTELDKMKAEMTAYRGQVNQHFSQTSELFQSLTERYRAVYQHLATGAHGLCTNGQEALPLDLPESTALPSAGNSGVSLPTRVISIIRQAMTRLMPMARRKRSALS